MRRPAERGTELVAQTGGDQTERERPPETGQIAQPVGERNLGYDGGNLPVPPGGLSDSNSAFLNASSREHPLRDTIRIT